MRGYPRIEGCRRPVADTGVQAPAGHDQEREAGPGLLVVDADVSLSLQWHGSLPLKMSGVSRNKLYDAPLSISKPFRVTLSEIVHLRARQPGDHFGFARA